MATPHISAGAAMFRQLYPDATPADVEVLLCQCAKDLGVNGKIVKVTHEDVQKAANEAQPRMAALMEEIIRRS